MLLFEASAKDEFDELLDFSFSFGDKEEEEKEEVLEEQGCQDKGIFDVAPCKFGAPLVLSFPHFLGADRHLTKGTRKTVFLIERAVRNFIV